jgi:2-keto-4-pentenoate hydratase/2-oxohepta-3-ene-1,7-dioic acid hydratase in catechol pathway
MKLITFIDGKNSRLGAIVEDRVVDLNGPAGFTSMLDLIQAGTDAWHTLAGIIKARTQHSLPLADVHLLAPLPNPPKIVAIGLNYMDHCREQNVPVPERPVVFTKFPNAIIGPGEAITWEPALTQQVDYEAELAVVIGKAARNVAKEHALEYVFGYTAINDVSARDLQFSDGQWVRAKSLDTFCPMGPVLVTADEIPDPQALKIRCLVNGRTLQDSSTSEMIYSTSYLISYLSRSFTLLPGDIISTGTPHGVGLFRNPQVFLQNGDQVVVEIDGIGTLANPVRVGVAG